MRVRARFAPAGFLAVAALYIATPASAQMRMPIEDLDRGLRAAESGGEIPLSNRPIPRTMTVTDRLDIRRLAVTCLHAADHPSPEAVQRRLDDLVADIGGALGEALAPFAGGEGVWLLRRVELEMTLDLDEVRRVPGVARDEEE